MYSVNKSKSTLYTSNFIGIPTNNLVYITFLGFSLGWDHDFFLLLLMLFCPILYSIYFQKHINHFIGLLVFQKKLSSWFYSQVYILFFSCVQFATEGERPEGTPRNIRLSAVTPTELELMWDEPDTELSHGTILRYNIGIREFRWDIQHHRDQGVQVGYTAS